MNRGTRGDLTAPGPRSRPGLPQTGLADVPDAQWTPPDPTGCPRTSLHKSPCWLFTCRETAEAPAHDDDSGFAYRGRRTGIHGQFLRIWPALLVN